MNASVDQSLEASARPRLAAAPRMPGAFTVGSPARHVLTLAATGSIGLMAVFAVDLLSLLYVSWLGDKSLTAGVGFASIVMFGAISINVGLMIAASALVARALGAGDRAGARRLAGSALVFAVLGSAIISVLLLLGSDALLRTLKADGAALAVAQRFLNITLPSIPLMAAGMVLSALLRAVGDARRAMYVTLAGGLATAAIDPILIFGLGLGVDGAAIATVLSRVVFVVVGMHGVVTVHKLLDRPRVDDLRRDFTPLARIAAPAVLTNLAAPAASLFVTPVVAGFGDWAVAANAVIDRLTPVAFGPLFALSGAVGPVLAQNWGAGLMPRVRRTLRDSFLLCLAYVACVWVLLIAASGFVPRAFGLTGEAAAGVAFYCFIAGPLWLCVGLLFTANAAFNNLGAPFRSTLFNWGRATIGTVPFVWLGAEYGGFEGIWIGMAIGAAMFGFGGAFAAFAVVRRLERQARLAPKGSPS